jgi:hypothetical protein
MLHALEYDATIPYEKGSFHKASIIKLFISPRGMKASGAVKGKIPGVPGLRVHEKSRSQGTWILDLCP